LTTNNENNKYWIGFNLIPGIGRVRFAQIENYFGDIEKAWNAGIDEFKKAGLDDNTIQSIAQWPQNFA
jgi:DNA processing protein